MTPSRGLGSDGAPSSSGRPGEVSVCSTSAAARGASCARCAPRALTRSASTSPRARSSARAATCPARSCTCSGPTEPFRSRTRASTSCGARRCSSTSPTPPRCCPRSGAFWSPAGRFVVTTPSHDLPRRVLIALLRWEEHFDPLGQHVRFYSRRSLTRTLETFAFEDVEVQLASEACSSPAPARRGSSSRAGPRARTAARTGGSRARRARTGTGARPRSSAPRARRPRPRPSAPRCGASVRFPE